MSKLAFVVVHLAFWGFVLVALPFCLVANATRGWRHARG